VLKRVLFILLPVFAFSFNLYNKKDNASFLTEQIAKYLNKNTYKIDNITYFKKAVPHGKNLEIFINIKEDSKEIKELNGKYDTLKTVMAAGLVRKFCSNSVVKKVMNYKINFNTHYFLKDFRTGKKQKLFDLTININSCKNKKI